ncbi:unnamed protein product [Vicia faba]|uniref:Replication factor A C-terminal domain-containing protein n=1 Tax=Vicia faba TaxID=3906 RepID=A0AAV0Z204_VICFA|nr:unnamed protein product [Vicia faba]
MVGFEFKNGRSYLVYDGIVVCAEFKDALLEDWADASVPIVVLLQYAKVKEEGKYPLSVTNTYHVTMLCLDVDFPLLTPVQKLCSKVVVLPITDIIKLHDITFCATVAETKVLVASPFGWYYHFCHLCPCIARGDIPLFECEAGHSIGAEIFRYKIEIKVAYAGKSCNFVFWNRECELLLGVSASQLRHTMIKMLNLEMTFKVKWKPRWKNCSVVMLLKNDPFIKEPKGPWKAIEVKESIDEAKMDAPDEYDVVADMEITFEHKPGPIRPAGKRQLLGGSSESTSFEGLYDGELSSNKLKMIIKLEKNEWAML